MRPFRQTWFGVVAAAALAVSPVPAASASPALVISEASEQILASMLTAPANPISAGFLGTPYGANTLVGSADRPEQLVVNLERVDCFTYADYVEALKRAGGDREAFIDSLIDVRYTDGIVSFANRKHFFTDWAATAPAVATDITAGLGDGAVAVTKNLNVKDSGGVHLPGLPPVSRQMSYLPATRIDSTVIDALRTGDYLGAYAEDGGLDVTHVGIFIDGPEGPVFRNASSLAADNRVVDTPLSEYLATVPGLVVLRPVVG